MNQEPENIRIALAGNHVGFPPTYHDYLSNILISGSDIYSSLIINNGLLVRKLE